ncbi:cell division protein SepF [Sanguibacter suarezii]|uniref:cell division protein SepF n=1 Tax=Sanguibacter suarezii TaxID=60921 RepID=UPI00082AAE43|nr:cell division protein SepF [Sanguibacter suarezii]
MAGALRKTMLYLGLADDRGEEIEDQFEEYDDYDEVGRDVTPEYEAQVTPINRSVSRQAPVAAAAPAELRRITTVHPRSYNDARVIGEAFRAGTPVIINLSDMDDADAKRLVDFSAGLIFGLRGAIERVTNKVFLLSPEHVEVSGQDHTVEKSAGRPGFYNQS